MALRLRTEEGIVLSLSEAGSTETNLRDLPYASATGMLVTAGA